MSDKDNISDMSEIDLKIAIKETDIKILEIERELLKSNIEVSYVNDDKDEVETFYKKRMIILIALYLLLVIVYFFMRDTHFMSLMGMPALSDKEASCLFFLMC